MADHQLYSAGAAVCVSSLERAAARERMRVHVCMYACVCVYVCMRACVHMYMRVQAGGTYVHTCVYGEFSVPSNARSDAYIRAR